MKFKVYYSDGSTYDGPVCDVPIFEVLLIVERDADHGRRIVSGGDYYVYDGGKWLSVDFVSMLQYMARPGMEKRFLVGVMVDSDKWNRTVKAARSDPDFPAQTALHAYETKSSFDDAQDEGI